MRLTNGIKYTILFGKTKYRNKGEIRLAGAKMVSLINGTYEYEPIVEGIIYSLSSLKEADPVAFHDLVMKCRDNDYQLSAETPFIIQNWVMLNINDGIDPSLRNVITVAVTGDGMEMQINNPIKEEA